MNIKKNISLFSKVINSSVLLSIAFSVSLWVIADIFFYFILPPENKTLSRSIINSAILGIIFGIVMYVFNKQLQKIKKENNT